MRHKVAPRLWAVVLAATLSSASCDWLASSDPVAVPWALTASGRLDAASEARVLSAERDGIIRKVLARPGAEVAQGETLAEIACDDADAALNVAREREQSARSALALAEADALPSELRSAEAAVRGERARRDDAADTLARSERLFESGILSERELLRHRREAEAQTQQLARASAELERVREGARQEERQVVRAALAVATAAIAQAETEVRKCKIVAPIDGLVLRVHRREGEFSGASQGAPIVTLADTSQMIARAEIDERDAAIVRVGMRAEVWIEGRTERYRGRVAEVASVVGRRTARTLDPADRFDRETVEAIVALDDPNAPRVVGLRVLVAFHEGAKHAAR